MGAGAPERAVGRPGHLLAAADPGRSIGFLFVPVNTLAIGSLAPGEVNQGVGLLGLARQLGGSLGIAILATFLQNHQHINRANLVGYLTPANPAYNERLAGLTGTLMAHGYSPADAQQGALGLIDQTPDAAGGRHELQRHVPGADADQRRR